jgi:hypothetical protein
MATDSDDEEEWRYSLSDLESESDDAASSGEATRDEDDAGDGGGIDAGVAGRMDIQEELEAQEIDLENALFVVFGVLLALAFFAGYLNLLP